jgi:hypothetical protein
MEPMLPAFLAVTATSLRRFWYEQAGMKATIPSPLSCETPVKKRPTQDNRDFRRGPAERKGTHGKLCLTEWCSPPAY